MAKALLLVDIQNDYFPGGAMELVGSVEAGDKARRLLVAFRRKSLPVIHLQHVALHPGATFFLPDTPGADIHECVAPEGDEIVVRKSFPNGFRDTPLLERLRALKVTELVMAGMMTHMCIDSTTRAAFDLGFECSLAHDACATKALSMGEITVPASMVHAAFLASLNGSFARVRAVDTLASEL
jgi:nicotinamidase-related amidase